MKQSRASVRYAKALLQTAIEKNLLQQSYNDMVLINNVCSESKDLLLLLKSPIVKTGQKLKILEEVFSSKLDRISMIFIRVITQKKREALLAEIANSFIYLYKKHNNIVLATATTAIPLSAELKKEIITYIKKLGDKDTRRYTNKNFKYLSRRYKRGPR